MRQRLVLAAHADDETIGCAGSLAVHAAGDAKQWVGVLSRDDDDHEHAVRRAEAETAWEITGVTGGFWAEHAQRPLTASSQLIRLVSQWIVETQARTVLVPHPGESDPDHAGVATIARHAMIRAGRFCTLVGYEVWTPLARVDLYEDITAVADQKAAAIRAYHSQSSTDHVRAALGLNQFRSATSGRGLFAEAFQVLGS